MVSEAFAAVLRSGRDHFNALFAQARRQHAGLEPGAFREFLASAVDPLVLAVEEIRPERVAEVALAAYETALALCAQRLAGPGSRTPSIREGWRRIAPVAAPMIAAAPHRTLSAICNALHQLATAPGARPMDWIAVMERQAAALTDLDEFLKVGQVAAWRAGLAHFRDSALRVADELSEPLALAAVGGDGRPWAEVKQKLAEDPWFVPDAPQRELRLARRAGAFRGYGGAFAELPQVSGLNGHFYVRSGADCWLLVADAFGATFHRATEAEFEGAAARPKTAPGLRISGSDVEWNGQRLDLSRFGEITSCAVNRTSVAVTASLTHSVLLVALGPAS